MATTRKLQVGVEFPLTDVEKKWFKNQTVKLNGYNFVGCRFDGCILWADNSVFILDCCFFVDCQILNAEPGPLEKVN